MATYVSYTPTGTFDSALFNFDSIAAISNFKYSGTVTVSVSAPFSFQDYLDILPLQDLAYTDFAMDPWSAGQVAQLNLITATYSNFINLQFSAATNYSVSNPGFNPQDVGSASNINVSIVYRDDLGWSGISSINADSLFGYTHGQGDVIINQAGVGDYDISFGPYTFGFHTLMHEIGHSLGLSHPHSAFSFSGPTITADYAATANVGFDKLGFQIDSSADMYKEYFSIMSYDDQAGADYFDTFAQTPMILDVLALQAAYGEGPGSTGSGNDTIKPGGTGGVDSYRVYFDTGGHDLINLGNYSFVGGAYLHMGTTITGAPHLVGVSMNMDDAATMFAGGDPASLRWFYGEYEDARGTSLDDWMIGNAMGNWINGVEGDDTLAGGAGNDSLTGGAGNDQFDWDADERAGNDTMVGGAGDDSYVLDSASDKVVEKLNEGEDMVFVTFSYSVASKPYIEDIGLLGSNAANLTGNAAENLLFGNVAKNIIKGGDGNDVLFGDGGNDNLTGGAGADIFVFDVAPNSVSNKDTLTDFAHGVDKIWLDDDVFGALGPVALPTTLLSSQFYLGPAAHDRSDRIIYNPETGFVLYDPDGTDPLQAVKIALLGADSHPDTITRTDFVIIT